MGYYSDVILVTEAKNRDIVEEIFLKYAEDSQMSPPNLLEWADSKEPFEYSDYQGRNRTERELIMWEWSGMRWNGYESWNHYVKLEQALEYALTYADAENPIYNKGTEYAHFGMIVVGEDMEDIRLIGQPYEYNLDVQRKITW